MKLSPLWIGLSGILLSINALAEIPNSGHTKTFLGPTGHVGFTSLLTDTTAYSFAGEFGSKNWRIGGTVGWNLLNTHHIKVSGEYLYQKINYPFFDGDKYSWVSQGALGAEYQYDLTGILPLSPQFGVDAYYSNVGAMAVGTETGTYVDSAGITQSFTNTQRLTDSNATGISPGITIQPWRGMRAGFDLNYDSVRYSRKYQESTNTQGFGGTLHLNQKIGDTMAIGASAGVRQIFNLYEADFGWNEVPYFNRWALKLVTSYTVGKSDLPSTYNVGLNADYFIDRCSGPCEEAFQSEFMSWIAKPAVYMPQVLSVPDESVTQIAIS